MMAKCMIATMLDKNDIQAGMEWLTEQDGGEHPEAIEAYFAH